MYTMLYKWLEKNRIDLENKNVILDNIKFGNDGYDCYVSSFDLDYKGLMARVTLQETGRFYAQIISKDDASTIILFDDYVSFNEYELNGFLACFIQILLQ